MTLWGPDELNALHTGVMEAASKAAADGAAWEAVQKTNIDSDGEPKAEHQNGEDTPAGGASPARLAAVRGWHFKLQRILLFGALAVAVVTATIFVKSQQESSQVRIDPLKQDESSYRAAVGDTARLRAYVQNCVTCAYKAEAIRQISELEQRQATGQDEQAYRNARGNLALLKAYLVNCKICTSASAARNEIGTLEKAALAEQEASTYQNARGNLDLLRAYVRNCRICTSESIARAEISRLEREAKFFVFEVCNRTSYRVSVAVSGRRKTDSDDWSVEGWWDVAPGSCGRPGRYAVGYIYAMAKVRGNTRGWRGNDTKKCVEFPGPFDRISRANYSCGSNEALESFKGFYATENITWTLDEEPTEPDGSSTPSTQSQEIYWEHNGSKMYLAANGASRRFSYQEPRPGLSGIGVKIGTLLFYGTRSGDTYNGIAYIFSNMCGPAAYQVSGSVSADQRQVTLYGRAPLKNANCQTVSYRDDVLIFTYHGP